MERVKEYKLLRHWSREWAVAVCRFFSFVGQKIEPRASYVPGECSAIELHHHLGYTLSLRLLKRALNLPFPVSTSGVTGVTSPVLASEPRQSSQDLPEMGTKYVEKKSLQRGSGASIMATVRRAAVYKGRDLGERRVQGRQIYRARI